MTVEHLLTLKHRACSGRTGAPTVSAVHLCYPLSQVVLGKRRVKRLADLDSFFLAIGHPRLGYQTRYRQDEPKVSAFSVQNLHSLFNLCFRLRLLDIADERGPPRVATKK